MIELAPEERLRRCGLRVTAARVAVLRSLDSAENHPSVDQLIERVRRAGVSVSTQGVYDVCEALRRVGLVRRIEPAGSPARYETRVGDNHHHLICRSCGTAVDVDCAIGHAACLEPSDARGFRIHEAEVTFWGTCPGCQHTPSEEIT